jgi:hypothetical protein
MRIYFNDLQFKVAKKKCYASLLIPILGILSTFIFLTASFAEKFLLEVFPYLIIYSRKNEMES